MVRARTRGGDVTASSKSGRTTSRRDRRPILEDRAVLERLYWTEGRSIRALAADLGCSRNAVRAALERHAIEIRSRSQLRPPQLDDREWLRQAYHRQRRSARSIARELNCSDGMVLAALHRLDIPTRPRRPRPSPLLADREFLEQRYWGERVSIAGIAKELACSPGAVRSAMLRHGIEVRAVGAPRIEQLYDRSWLAAARRRRTSAEIARLLDCSEVTVRWALWRSGMAPGPPRRRRPAELDDLAFLFAAYVTERRSARSIAAQLRCSTATVLQALRRNGIAVRSARQQASAAALREEAAPPSPSSPNVAKRHLEPV